MSQQPTAKYRDDYRAPDFTITDINLEFDLDPNKTQVTAVSQVKRLNEQATELVLDGDDLTLLRLDINGDAWTAYSEEAGKLIIRDVPAAFTLTIQTQLDPENNSALEGLYISGGAYCTQCEAEGFRRITYYLDRPDVLARFTTKVIADKEMYPYLLSNGNKMLPVILIMAVTGLNGMILMPNQATCLPWLVAILMSYETRLKRVQGAMSR